MNIPTSAQLLTTERDSETGYSYFGSRYYSSDLSVWLSVDPQSDKYPSLSPYTYCADNPVRLVDPNGEDVDDNLDKWKYNKTTGQLSWYSNTGGKCHQIVVETENTSAGEQVRRTVEFDGAIGRMFNFSVFNPKLDDIINGIIEIKNGAKTFGAGLSIGFASEGFGTALSAGFCFWGAKELGEGFINVMKALAGEASDPYNQQNIVKDILNTAVNTGSGLIKDKANSGAQIFKYTTKNFAKSFIWGALQYYFVSHPKCLGAPEGSTIKKKK